MQDSRQREDRRHATVLAVHQWSLAPARSDVKNVKTGSLMCVITQSACTGAQAKYEGGNAALVEDKQPGSVIPE
jgi:hypothetical protein